MAQYVPGTPLGFQQITSLTAAVSLTVPAGARTAWLSIETANVRMRDDGTAPTATVGLVLVSGNDYMYSGNLPAIKLIAATGTPVVDVLYYS